MPHLSDTIDRDPSVGASVNLNSGATAADTDYVAQPSDLAAGSGYDTRLLMCAIDVDASAMTSGSLVCLFTLAGTDIGRVAISAGNRKVLMPGDADGGVFTSSETLRQMVGLEIPSELAFEVNIVGNGDAGDTYTVISSFRYLRVAKDERM